MFNWLLVICALSGTAECQSISIIFSGFYGFLPPLPNLSPSKLPLEHLLHEFPPTF